MELGELLLLVKTNPNDGSFAVVTEANFVRYMTTDTDLFYPQASASPSSNRAHPDMNGYAWFTENLEELAENTGSSEVTYLIDVCNNFAGYDFDDHCAHREDTEVYAFMYASALNPTVLTNLAVRGFGVAHPFARKQIMGVQTPSPPVEADPRDTTPPGTTQQGESPRPIWLL